MATAITWLWFVTVHLSPYERYAADRTAQAGDLLAFWRRRPRTILAGDFNARPGEASIRLLFANGLLDVTVPHGMGETFTYASGRPYERLDYIFSSPDVESLSTSILKVLASDHLPVTSRVRLHAP